MFFNSVSSIINVISLPVEYDEKKLMDEAKQKASLPEELTKIGKDLQVCLREKEEVVVENTT